MSVWTHVAAVFRIDGFRNDKFVNDAGHVNWDRVTGKVIYDGDWCTEDTYEMERMRKDWESYRKHPQRFVPTGSEGSLQRLVWVNPKTYCADTYTVTVFGDLRDYEDYEAIHEWFNEVCKKCHIRQAVCHCDVSGTTYTWTWGFD